MAFFKTSLSVVLSLVFSILLVVPLLAFAGDPNVSPNPTFEPVTLDNPLANIDSLEELLVALLNIFIVLMIPVIVFFIIYAGFKYVVAQGNPSKIEEAHRTLLYAIIGGVLVLAAVAISEIIANTVNQFTTP